MTALLAFLRIAWPYLLCAAAAGYGVHEVDQIPYDRQATAFASYKAQVAEEGEKAQKAAADALQAQITTRLTTEVNNGKVIAQLTADRDSAAADRDFARRLLAAAQAVPTTPSHPVTPAAGRPGAADPTPASGDRSLVADLTASAAETRQCFEQLSALQAEIAPQVNP